MEVPSSRPENHFHARSISLPSTSHPVSASLQEEVEQLRQWEASCTNPTAEMCCTSLHGLGRVYDCIQDLLHLPQTQKSFLHHQQNKWIEEMQDASMRLVDMCETTRDVLLHMKESVRELQSSIRTIRGGESGLRCKINAFMCLRKKMKKEIKRCIVAMKFMEPKIGASPTLDEDQHMSMLARELREASLITISIFQSFLYWISSARQKPKASKWTLLSRMLHKGVVACEGEKELNEVENVDQALALLSGCLSNNTQDAQMKLRDLESCIEKFESGYEFLFRQLIRTRVSLLNIFTP